MAKNIIVCCDGTGNQFDETYSNVVKLYTMLVHDPDKQICYYDPGVGTLSDPNVVTPLYKFISKVGGLAFGWGLKRNVTEAYSFLMENYEEDDKIFLFGFSRGAYTIRVLAALIYQAGLLRKGSQNLIPYAWETYRLSFKSSVFSIARQFRATYSRKVDIHFVGAWDTVTSIGIFNRKKLPHTTSNPAIRNVRHAVAIDEFRTYYRQNLFAQVASQNKKEVWFAGAHSDVGGSYRFDQSGLSQITLSWMLKEAVAFGLIVDPVKKNQTIPQHKTNGISAPDFNEAVHKSLKGFWYVLECLPKFKRRGFPLYFPAGRERDMYLDNTVFPPVGITPTIHSSVVKKMNMTPYRPKNILKNNFAEEE